METTTWYMVHFENGATVNVEADGAEAAKAAAIESLLACTGLPADRLIRVVGVDKAVGRGPAFTYARKERA
jgi:hypothetical protein